MTGFTIERHDDVLLLRMAAGKANAMSPDFLAGLAGSLDEARRATGSEARALVITGSGRAFSAGLALPVLVGLDRDGMRTFMTTFADTMESVLTFPLPTVAAINGHAIAGGCVLALMCDVRVMADGSSRIGLNEAAIGIGLPAIVVESLRARVPARAVTAVALTGQLFPPDEALRLGLVDQVVEPDQCEPWALMTAGTFAPSPWATTQIKSALLRPLLTTLRDDEHAELEAWLDTWFSEGGQASIARAAAALRR